MLHRAMQNKWGRMIIGLAATLLYCVAVNFFIVPMGLYTGGLLGLCQVIRTVIVAKFNLSSAVDFSGILYLIVNVPIFLLAWRSLGKGFLFRTVLCTLATSFFLSVLQAPATPIIEERITSCMVGGIVAGFALGTMLTCGCSGGGLDIIGLWLTKRGSGFSVGRFSMGFNVFLYALCALLFNIQTVVYSVIYMVFSALFVDRGHQQNINAQAMIFTKAEPKEMAQAIMGKLGRGLTYWEGKGAYTGNDIHILCVCISKFEESELREVIHTVDEHAFFTMQEGVRINGNFVKKLS